MKDEDQKEDPRLQRGSTNMMIIHRQIVVRRP